MCRDRRPPRCRRATASGWTASRRTPPSSAPTAPLPTAPRSSPSTKTVSTPQRGRISLHTTKHEPNRLRAATNLSPGSSAPARRTPSPCRRRLVRERGRSALDQPEPLLEHRDGGIAVARVDVAVDLTGERLLRVRRGRVDVPRGEEHTASDVSSKPDRSRPPRTPMVAWLTPSGRVAGTRTQGTDGPSDSVMTVSRAVRWPANPWRRGVSARRGSLEAVEDVVRRGDACLGGGLRGSDRAIARPTQEDHLDAHRASRPRRSGPRRSRRCGRRRYRSHSTYTTSCPRLERSGTPTNRHSAAVRQSISMASGSSRSRSPKPAAA